MKQLLFALLIASTAQADWEATGVDDRGWWEYRVRESWVNPDNVEVEYYHYGTGETRRVYLHRNEDSRNYLKEHGRKRWAKPWEIDP